MLNYLFAAFFFSLLSPAAPATTPVPKALPPEAKKYLDSLPQKKLTLDLIIGQAVNEAAIFNVHRSEIYRAESTELKNLAVEDLKLTAGYNYFDLQTDPLNPRFNTIRSSGWLASVGAEQYLTSGTTLSVLGTHGPQKLQYETNPTVDVSATALSVGIKQSLLGDMFGAYNRNLIKSGTQFKKSIIEGMMNQIELSTMDIITMYYQTWLKQQIAQNLKEGQERKDKLVGILKGQERRRILETADLLQVESLTLSTQADYLNTKRDLQGVWEQLVINLKLPQELLKVDASEIPIALDSPETKSVNLCHQLTFADLQKNSYAIKEVESASLAADQQMKALKYKLMPDLTVNANYTANGVDPSARETFKNVEGNDYPAITAGVNLSFPIQNRAQKSLYLAARAQYEQANYKRKVLLDNLQASWSVLCKTLDQKRISRDIYQQVNLKNKKRVTLENKRFHMGRLRPLEWTQAEETEAADYLKYQMAEVEVRQVSWEIQRQSGAMSDYLKPLIKIPQL